MELSQRTNVMRDCGNVVMRAMIQFASMACIDVGWYGIYCSIVRRVYRGYDLSPQAISLP
jgi:TRAP-type mannitol/chloroaromatic compound transport system permease small subunit